MNNLFDIRSQLTQNGQKLAYQHLDGLNWKQYTYLDILNFIDYTVFYFINSKILNKKVLNLATTSLENTIISFCFAATKCEQEFRDFQEEIRINDIETYDVIIIDKIDEDIANELEGKIVISIESLKTNFIKIKNFVDFKSINKFGLLGRNKIDDEIKNKYFSQNFSDEKFIFDDMENKNFLDQFQKLVNNISEVEFSIVFYQKKDLMSLKICPFLIKYKRKFINFLDWEIFQNNINETLPSNLFIDSDNLQKAIDLSNNNKIKFFNKNLKRIITSGIIDSDYKKRLNNLKIDLINF